MVSYAFLLRVPSEALPIVVGAGVVPVSLLAALVALVPPVDGAQIVAVFLVLLSLIGLCYGLWG